MQISCLLIYFFCLFFSVGLSAAPQPTEVAPMDAAPPAPAYAVAEAFLAAQSKNLPGKVQISMGQVDLDRLSPCRDYQAFMPPGSKQMGRVYVGLRCLSPQPWSILIPAQIAVIGNYVTAAKTLNARQIIRAEDIFLSTGDLASLPPNLATSADFVIGRATKRQLAVGQTIRLDQISLPQIIKRGQQVKVHYQSTRFAATSEGKAQHDAGEGDTLAVKMSSGQIVHGTVQSDGLVLVQ